MPANVRPGQSRNLPANAVLAQCGTAWDFGASVPIQLDTHCLMFDPFSRFLSCVHYAETSSSCDAVKHSGKNDDDAHQSDNRTLTVELPKLASNVACMAFVVCAHDVGDLSGVRSVRTELRHKGASGGFTNAFVTHMPAGAHDTSSAVALCMLIRDPKGVWTFIAVDEDLGDAVHYLDMLPLLTPAVEKVLPMDPLRSKSARILSHTKTLNMTRGDELVFDTSDVGGQIACCLGWDPDTSTGAVDLDSSCIKVFRDGTIDTSHVYYGNRRDRENYIKHSGDNITGEGEGDDERIFVDLRRVGQKIAALYFVITIYSPGKHFSNVKSEYARIINRENKELCRFTMDTRSEERASAMIIAKVYRRGSGWCFSALGEVAEGRTVRACEDEVQKLEAEAMGRKVSDEERVERTHADEHLDIFDDDKMLGEMILSKRRLCGFSCCGLPKTR